MVVVQAEPLKETDVEQRKDAVQAPEKKPTSRAGKFEISIYGAWCKDCGLCVDFCPKGAITRDKLGAPEATSPEKCLGCMLCVLHCPDFAISVTPKDDPEKPEV